MTGTVRLQAVVAVECLGTAPPDIGPTGRRGDEGGNAVTEWKVIVRSRNPSPGFRDDAAEYHL